jgi:hypothetical protein
MKAQSRHLILDGGGLDVRDLVTARLNRLGSRLRPRPVASVKKLWRREWFSSPATPT